MAEETSHDIQFLPEHPDYESKIQHYTGKRPADTYTVALTGPLSENQPLEDGIHGGHPETEAMQNDLALILLALLMPWNQLLFLCTMFNCNLQNYKDHYAEIWNFVKPSLPCHIQDVAQNIELL